MPVPPDREETIFNQATVRRWARLGVLGLGLVLLAGCVVVPVPREGRKVTAKWERWGQSLLATGASRADIEHELGPPHLDFTDLKVAGYTWSAGEWGFLWAVGGGYVGDGGYYKPTTHRVLWLQFDDKNRLVRFEVRHRKKKPADWDQAATWARSAPLPFPPAHTRADTVAAEDCWDGDTVLGENVILTRPAYWYPRTPGWSDIVAWSEPVVPERGFLVFTATRLHFVPKSGVQPKLSLPLVAIHSCHLDPFGRKQLVVVESTSSDAHSFHPIVAGEATDEIQPAGEIREFLQSRMDATPPP